MVVDRPFWVSHAINSYPDSTKRGGYTSPSMKVGATQDAFWAFASVLFLE